MEADELDLPITVQDLSEVLATHGVLKASIFGSYARGEAGPDSDPDILVEYRPGVTLSQRIACSMPWRTQWVRRLTSYRIMSCPSTAVPTSSGTSPPWGKGKQHPKSTGSVVFGAGQHDGATDPSCAFRCAEAVQARLEQLRAARSAVTGHSSDR